MMIMTKLIAIVGMPGSGKSIAADFFKAKHIPILRFGDQTDIGVKEAGLPLTEKNERWYRENIRKELGMAAMAIKIYPRILKEQKKSDTIVLDGLYSWEEYEYLKEKFPDIFLLHIYAPPHIRHERLHTRVHRPLTTEEAVSRDKAEIENLHKGGPIAIADYVISNTTSPKDFQERLEQFYSTLL
jgi:dephospho-CoA kinase